MKAPITFMEKLESILEIFMFRSRWTLAPMYLGLVGALIVLMVKFLQEFFHLIPHILDIAEKELVLAILSLVDITLVANLLVMVIFSGYENFVSKINVKNHEDRPEWMGKVSYSGLKIKMIGSIVAISAIDLLKAFMHQTTPGVEQLKTEQLAWMLGIHSVLLFSGVLFALMDKIADKSH